jgi:hypothetical protein
MLCSLLWPPLPLPLDQICGKLIEGYASQDSLCLCIRSPSSDERPAGFETPAAVAANPD